MTESDPSQQSNWLSRAWVRNLLWLVAALIGTGVLSITAAYAPTVMKKLVLFYALIGIATGESLAWLAVEIRPAWRRSLPWATAVICMLGAAHVGWLSYTHFFQEAQAAARQHPKDVAALNMLEKMAGGDPELQQKYAAERRKYAPAFSDYLAHRVSVLGNWPMPWPELFWAVEILIAGTMAGFFFARRRRQHLATTTS